MKSAFLAQAAFVGGSSQEDSSARYSEKERERAFFRHELLQSSSWWMSLWCAAIRGHSRRNNLFRRETRKPCKREFNYCQAVTRKRKSWSLTAKVIGLCSLLHPALPNAWEIWWLEAKKQAWLQGHEALPCTKPHRPKKTRSIYLHIHVLAHTSTMLICGFKLYLFAA